MTGVFFKSCDSPPANACGIPMVDVQGGCQLLTKSQVCQQNCISPSFIPILKEMIPRYEAMLGFGGSWFWNCYLNALHGEDIFLDLKGTGVSLSEDSLDAQVSLRRKLTSLDDAKMFEVAAEHCCSKVEALCAMCLSIVLHVSHRPMLESEQGPQALVLCATKDQCDELYVLLDRFGSALHLVTHNLFGAYPPMPSGKRADIVVGTVPLWESVAKLSLLGTLDGLEEILYQVSHDSRWTASSTRWRPYSLDFVVQLFFVDLDLQHALGYGPMLQRLFMEHKRPVLPGPKPVRNKILHGTRHGSISFSGLPQRCQMYCLVGGCGKGKDLFEILLALRDRRGDGRNKNEVVRISMKQPLVHSDKNGELVTDAPRKRVRDDHDHGVAIEKESKREYPRLVVHNALSHSRLMLDAAAFEEFAAETKRRAQNFWSRFEATSSPNENENHRTFVIDVQLAYLCIGPDQFSVKNERTWFMAETVAIITPIGDGAAHPSRTALLMRHLEDELSGQIFDGSVVQCLFQRGSIDRVASGAVLLNCVFSATAKSISQEPLFLRFATEDEEVKEEGGEAKKENTDLEMVDTLANLTHLRQLAQEASSEVEGASSFPLHKFLAVSRCQSRRTVLSFRQIAPTISLFCDAQSNSKSMALLYLEECCQYGKVVSYFIFGQRRGGKDGKGCVHFFVEFAGHEGAAEAVRQFSLRFASEGKETENHMRVKLFPNELYYEGVTAELQKRRGKTGKIDDTSDYISDSDDDEFMGVSLLGE
ncbi:hypothetical protein TCSYLVIO_001813 [Trypanosoma cruzi]|nr:hypothetical protein TCSYLVIO_001813 [Trypanosoma cruzi]